MACDSSDDETDRRIRAELGALLAASRKRIRRPIPPHLRTPTGRFALSLWRKQVFLSMDEEQYLKWWMDLLDNETRTRIDAAIAPFPTYELFKAAFLKQLRPKAVCFEVGPEDALINALYERLPQIASDKYLALLRKPVKRRSRYAEAFGKRVTRVLKDFLEVPAHRPSKIKASATNTEDDKWLRRLAAYIWNFPEKFS